MNGLGIDWKILVGQIINFFNFAVDFKQVCYQTFFGAFG